MRRKGRIHLWAPVSSKKRFKLSIFFHIIYLYLNHKNQSTFAIYYEIPMLSMVYVLKDMLELNVVPNI